MPLVGVYRLAGDERGDDVGGVAVEGHSGAVVAHGACAGRRGGGVLHVAQRHPGVEAAVMKAWRKVCGPIALVIPARRATRQTIRLAP